MFKFITKKVHVEKDIEKNISTSTDESIENNGKISTKKFRKNIIINKLQPAYINDISDTIDGRYKWRKIGEFLFVVAKALALINVIFSYLGTFLKNEIITFVGAVGGTVGLYLMHHASEAIAESRKKNNEANELLRDLGIDGLPDILNEDNDPKGPDGKPIPTMDDDTDQDDDNKQPVTNATNLTNLTNTKNSINSINQ